MTAIGRDCVKTRFEFFAVGPHISERIQTAAEVELPLATGSAIGERELPESTHCCQRTFS